MVALNQSFQVKIYIIHHFVRNGVLTMPDKLYTVKQYLLDLVHQVRIGINPAYTFEKLDELGVTFRAQNEVCRKAEDSNVVGLYIVN